MRHPFIYIALLLPWASALAAAQPAVKKSEQGICHERGSGAYQRTKHYESFDTLELCLASGGRVPRYAEADGADAQEKPAAPGSSWLRNLGGKIALILGMLVIVGGAFLLSRRQAGGTPPAAGPDPVEPNRWEDKRRE